MAKITAVRCDAKGCTNIDEPSEGAELPYGWLLVDFYQEGEGNLGEGKVFCSWACTSAFTQREATPAKRKRRTKAQIAADAAALSEFEATERSMGVPPAVPEPDPVVVPASA